MHPTGKYNVGIRIQMFRASGIVLLFVLTVISCCFLLAWVEQDQSQVSGEREMKDAQDFLLAISYTSGPLADVGSPWAAHASRGPDRPSTGGLPAMPPTSKTYKMCTKLAMMPPQATRAMLASMNAAHIVVNMIN